jgi:uncharacterized protein with von Willebrand factor type A (vWA) domain
MIFVTPGSEAFFKSGLAKSAFNSLIYGDLPLDFFLPGIDTALRLAKLHNVAPKFYQVHDLFLAFYQPYEAVFTSLKKSNRAAPAWRAFVEGLIRRPEFLELNQLTRGSFELAAAAAARTLAIALNMRVQISSDSKHTYDLDVLNQIIKDVEQNNAPAGLEQEIQGAGGVQRYLRLVERWVREAGKAAAAQLPQVLAELQNYVEAREEAEAAAAALAGGHGYSLNGLSIWHFYEKPDEFRRRVKLLAGAALALRRFSRVLPASLSHQQAESLWGGVDGVAKMTQYAQLKEALPSELAYAHVSQALFAVKLAQTSLVVYRRATAAKYVLFVDKSGSMAEALTGERGSLGPGDSMLRRFLGAEERLMIPKISLAAGLALALFRRFNAEVYLFDTEVDRAAPRDVVNMLLAIKADGGTNIAAVMEEIMRIDRPDNVYLIVSDGITDANQELTMRFAKYAPRVKLILVPPSREDYQWIQLLKKHRNVVYARDVAQFEEAARHIFTHTL